MHGRTDGRTDNVKTVYPLQTKFAGGITMFISIKRKFWTHKRNVSMRRFFYAPKTYGIIDIYLIDSS